MRSSSTIRRTSFRAARPLPLVRLAGAACCGIAAAAAILVALAEYQSTRDPRLAIKFWPWHAEALARAAELSFSEGDTALAVREAHRALARTPRQVRSMRVLALAASATDAGKSAALMTQAGAWSWREDSVHRWLFEHGAAERLTPAALESADALLRQNPDANAWLLPRLVLSAQDPAAARLIGAKLAQRPPWRVTFLHTLGMQASGQAAEAVLQALASRGAGVDAKEISPYLQRLVRQNAFEEARATWRRYLPGPNAILPDDGAFSRSEGALPFAWELLGGRGAEASLEEAPTRAGNQALLIDYDGYANTPIAQTLVVLKPGRWRLSGEVFLESKSGQGRLAWTLRCAETGQEIAQVQTNSEPGQWAPFTSVFDIPAANCAAQWLWLRPNPLERRVNAATWYDNLSLRPVAIATENQTAEPAS